MQKQWIILPIAGLILIGCNSGNGANANAGNSYPASITNNSSNKIVITTDVGGNPTCTVAAASSSVCNLEQNVNYNGNYTESSGGSNNLFNIVEESGSHYLITTTESSVGIIIYNITYISNKGAYTGVVKSSSVTGNCLGASNVVACRLSESGTMNNLELTLTDPNFESVTPAPTPTPSPTPTPTPSPTPVILWGIIPESQTDVNTLVNCNNVPVWNYWVMYYTIDNQGMLVSYNGIEYISTSATRNDNPAYNSAQLNLGQPWLPMGTCE